jgi:hypothetical protein
LTLAGASAELDVGLGRSALGLLLRSTRLVVSHVCRPVLFLTVSCDLRRPREPEHHLPNAISLYLVHFHHESRNRHR